MPLSVGKITLLKEKGGMGGRLIRRPLSRDRPGILKEEERTNIFFFFFPIHSLVLVIENKMVFSLSLELMVTQKTMQFKLYTKDYITIMYPA